MIKKVSTDQSLPEMERKILAFWNEEKIFEKTLEKTKEKPAYAFYDGPPFATGFPHYGHLVGSVMKDVVPRYWTMRGYYVERKWGWDCHGLPIENIVEKELGSRAKKDIEALGVEKFNELCRAKVLTYVSEWEKVINRLGRWADMKNCYKTMDLEYMESVWWVFKELWKNDLVYKDYRSMHICPRCETTLSQSEVAEGYMNVKDLSVTAKFNLIDEQKTFILAWTTTPWTLIGNVALAINQEITYAKVKIKNPREGIKIDETENIILAKDRLAEVLGEGNYEIIAEVKGLELVGKKYKPLFDYYSKDEKLENYENGWKIYAADFVTTEEGVGVVHIAPAFGEDDMNLGKKYNLPFIQHVGIDGHMKPETKEFSGLHVKPKENHTLTDIEIIKYLAKKNTLFAKEKYEHSYPHCWRCDTPLLNYVTSSWFVRVTKIKEEMLKNAKNINWSPAHVKNGRFGKWLEGARDWSVSRQRFWASVMPIWECECGEKRVFGSVKELEEASGKKVTDLHKHVVDHITVVCEKCRKTMHRVPDVLDTWFDSGSMPYAQMHYPFENKEKFEAGFPAEFIAEGIDQTRAWFYYLHVISTGVKKSHAFKNVIVNGIVVAEDGKKMSKKLNNYPDPLEIIERYGADVLRYYLMSSQVVMAENLNFSEKELKELSRGMFRMLWNSYAFFSLYASVDKWKSIEEKSRSKNVLDKWIISELHVLTRDVNQNMENYELAKTARLFPLFIDNLSNWYIRRGRKRFWKSENDDDKNDAYETLNYVLIQISKLMAPFTPFIADEIFINLTGKNSVHLEKFPQVNNDLIDEELSTDMKRLRDIISTSLQLRAKVKINARQPLLELIIEKKSEHKEFSQDLLSILKEEVNVKDVCFRENFAGCDTKVYSGAEVSGIKIALRIELTEALKREGDARELIRHIQQLRKKIGYEVDDRICLYYKGGEEIFTLYKDMIAHEVLASSIDSDMTCENTDAEEVYKISNEEIEIKIKKS